MKSSIVFGIFFFLVSYFVSAAELQLEVNGIPINGLVVQTIDFEPARHWFDLKSADGAELRCGDVIIPHQLVAGSSGKMILVAQFSDELVRRSQSETLICTLNISPGNNSATKINPADEIITETPVYRIQQAAKLQGGMPSRIEFRKTGRVLETHQWFDRLYHAERPGFNVSGSTDAQLTLLSDGSICRVVRNDVRFQGQNLSNEKSPRVAYTWFYFKQKPGLVFVTAEYSQPELLEWSERHFLELHVSDGSFTEYLDWQKSAQKTKFDGSKKMLSAKGAAILDGENRISMFGSGNVTVYDGLREFGPYILGNGHQAWTPWTETTAYQSGWICFDAGESSIDIADVEQQANVRLSIPALDQTAKTWLDVARNALFYAGIFKTKEELNAFKADGTRFTAIGSKKLGMLLEKTETENNQGVRLIALVDIPSLTLLTPPEPQSLFSVKLRELQDGKPGFTLRTLTSDRGWKSVNLVLAQQSDEHQLLFEGIPNISGGEAVCLPLRIKAFHHNTAEAWYDRSSISVTWNGNISLPSNLTLQSATLPQLRLASFGTKMKGFYPQASGLVVNQPFGKEIRWSGRYPGGWSSMPWFAVWNDAAEKPQRIGLYVAAHDADAATKEQSFHADSQTGIVQISEEYHAENLGRSNSAFAPCNIVLESYRGDWFDAAMMYRDWVRREASWYPRTKITEEGRTDTPLWMRELAVWAQHWQAPDKMPGELQEFQSALGVPAAVHWYGWHKIPFDNDYPHYFPTQDGFKAAVTEIQKDGNRFVMPYINGRLWDSRDRGLEDWLFTKEALSGVTKKEDGSAWLESYGSKESDGSNVKLGVMCSSTGIWQRKLQELIGRLTNPSDSNPGDDGNMGVKAVYVDQVAAATPELCFDASHGHPLGGGTWWVKSYRNIFKKIRAELPKDAMLTTECNGEPYIDLFDGYLTWHFQHDGEVPAFAAVYGGAIQMFGRAYGGGPDDVIATKMKLAESFVFGEQIGWITPLVVNEPQKFDFLKKVVALRYQFREYFYKGEMARPPKLYGNMPRITADWHFSGNPTIVTTDIVRAGAWKIPSRKSAILLFANFSDQSVENRLEFNVTEIGLDPAKIKVVRHNADGSAIDLPALSDSLKFDAEEIFVLEIKP